MKFTTEQTDKILQKLKDYGFEIIDKQQGHKEQLDIFNIQVISEEYFNEKLNEALEEEKETTQEIINFSKNLIEAIDSNQTSGQVHENEFCGVIPSQYIADELEELRGALK